MAVTDGIELVTGYAGRAHVSSDDIAAFNRGVFGYDAPKVMRLDNGTDKISTRSTTMLVFPQSDWLVEGRFVRVNKAVNVPIPIPPVSSTQTYYLYFVYSKATSGVESFSLELNSYSYYESSISSGSAYKLATLSVTTYSVDVTDQSVLENRAANLHNLDYQMTSSKTMYWKVPYSDSSIRITRIGSLVLVNGNVKFTQAAQLNYSSVSESIPYGYRPTEVNTPIQCGTIDCAFLVDQNGAVVGLGNPNSAYTPMQGAWVTTDSMPS